MWGGGKHMVQCGGEGLAVELGRDAQAVPGRSRHEQEINPDTNTVNQAGRLHNQDINRSAQPRRQFGRDAQAAPPTVLGPIGLRGHALLLLVEVLRALQECFGDPEVELEVHAEVNGRPAAALVGDQRPVVRHLDDGHSVILHCHFCPNRDSPYKRE